VRVVLAQERQGEPGAVVVGAAPAMQAGGRSGSAQPQWVFPSSTDLWFLAALGRKEVTPARERVSVFSA